MEYVRAGCTLPEVASRGDVGVDRVGRVGMIFPSHPFNQKKKTRIMHSEVRQLITSHGPVRIFCNAGEAGWKAVVGEIPAELLTHTRSGVAGTSYASQAFLNSFCDQAGLIPRPIDDDLQLVAAESIGLRDDQSAQALMILWSEKPGTLVTSQPVVSLPDQHPTADVSQLELLRSINLDFTVPLMLPNGSPPPRIAYDWQFRLKEGQLSFREAGLLRAVRATFLHPGSYHRPISPDYCDNVAECMLKLWGVYRNQLRVPRFLCSTMRMFDPYLIAYYFRYVACPIKPGRNYSKSVLKTEVYCLEHGMRAMCSLASRGEQGLRMDQIPHGLTADAILQWISRDVKRAADWKAHNGSRKKERDVVCRLVSEKQFDTWVEGVRAEVEAMMQLDADGELEHTIEAAENIQDLAVCLFLGAGMPTQRSGILTTLAMYRDTGFYGCAVPGCTIANCPGNTVYTKQQYVREFGTDPDPDSDRDSIYIAVGHCKNHRKDQAKYEGPLVHTPEVTPV